MLNKTKENAWFYHRGEWSIIKNPLQNSSSPLASASPRRTARRQGLREYNCVWLNLGPTPIPYDYSGLLASVYSYTGSGKAPKYLIRIISLSSEDAVYVGDFPDLLEILSFLTPLVSNGIFADAYTQGSRK